jgi:hypothetical protein
MRRMCAALDLFCRASTPLAASICALIEAHGGRPPGMGSRPARGAGRRYRVKWHVVPLLGDCDYLACGDQETDPHGADVLVGKDLEAFVPVEVSPFL